MNPTETQLIEEGWSALVERLGSVEATRFVMLLDRRTGGAMQHLHYIQSNITPNTTRHQKHHARYSSFAPHNEELNHSGAGNYREHF
jgi:hypothetical protein